MATQTLTTRFQLKRGMSEAWERNNPILAAGEPGWTLDTHILKIGDGKTKWLDLEAVTDSKEVMRIVSSLQQEVITIKQTSIPGISALLEAEEKRAKEAENLLSDKVASTEQTLVDLTSQIKTNTQSIIAILDADKGLLKQAKDYTNQAIAELIAESGHGVDGATIKIKDNKAYVAAVSTDVLEQGEMELILFAGSANI